MSELIVDERDAIVTLTLNRPQLKNAISIALFEELRDTLRAIAQEQRARCVVITGAGGDFAAGADLSKAGQDRGDQQSNTLYSMRIIHDSVQALVAVPVPVIAKVRGVAVGAGLSLAMAADLVISSESARYGAVFAKRGLSLDCGASWLLPRLVGMHKAKEIALFGDIFSARDAHAAGLVNRVVADGELDAAVDELAQRLASGPTIALSMTKRLLNNAFESSFVDALEAEAMAQAINGTTHDTREGMIAFLQKRPPNFAGR